MQVGNHFVIINNCAVMKMIEVKKLRAD